MFLFSLATFHAQVFKNVILKDQDAEFKVEEITINKETNILSYVDDNQNLVTKDLNNFQSIQYKKGSHWLAGMGGGFLGSLLGSVALKSDEGEWWHGAGPAILIGTGAGAIVGALIPKYKSIEVSNNTEVEVTPIAIRFKF